MPVNLPLLPSCVCEPPGQKIACVGDCPSTIHRLGHSSYPLGPALLAGIGIVSYLRLAVSVDAHGPGCVPCWHVPGWDGDATSGHIDRQAVQHSATVDGCGTSHRRSDELVVSVLMVELLRHVDEPDAHCHDGRFASAFSCKQGCSDRLQALQRVSSSRYCGDGCQLKDWHLRLYLHGAL